MGSFYMDIDFRCTKSNNETKKYYYNGVNFLYVNGHTTVRPGMACIPLDNH